MKLSTTEETQVEIERSWHTHKVEGHERSRVQFNYIKIQCMYFKQSGKYYSDGCEWFDKLLFNGCIYPSEYGERLRELKKLPGLQSGTWEEGFFTVKVQGKYTELVMPIK